MSAAVTAAAAKKKQSSLKSLVQQMGSLLLSWRSTVSEASKLLEYLEVIQSTATSIRTTVKKAAFQRDASAGCEAVYRSAYSRAGPLIIAKLSADAEPIFLQLKQFMTTLSNITLAMQATSQEAMSLVLDEDPQMFTNNIFDTEHVLNIQMLEKQHTLECDRKRGLVNQVISATNLQSHGASLERSWADDSSDSFIQSDLRDLFLLSNNIT